MSVFKPLAAKPRQNQPAISNLYEITPLSLSNLDGARTYVID
jgi:hypothetical protein